MKQKIGIAIAVVMFAGVGIYMLTASSAATIAKATEAESGTLGGLAALQDTDNASGGKVVRFGSNPVNGIAAGGCMSGSNLAPCIGGSTSGAAGWGVPVFDDEFNGTALNTDNWGPDWFGSGTMNGVVTKASNVSVADGKLVLTLKSLSEGALVSTNPNGGARRGFQFGTGHYAEARVYFPGNGDIIYNWPAWWTDGQNWPANGEIDIAEGLDTLTSNYHSNSGANNSNTVAGTWSNNYHTYGVDRQPGKNSIYWDGKLIRTYTTDDNGSPHYFIINVGRGTHARLGAESQVKVDYVRVWRK